MARNNHQTISQHSSSPELRLDKWLWAARFFKTRELAASACDLGRVEHNGTRAKPSRTIRAGDTLLVRNEGGEFGIEVLEISEARGPAAVAQTLFRESDESRIRREQLAAERKALHSEGMPAPAKPNRRDRGTMERMRGR